MNHESKAQANLIVDSKWLDQVAFVRRLELEQKRTERSRRPFVLMLLKSSALFGSKHPHAPPAEVRNALANSTRETDIKGWYENGTTIGIIFTELGSNDGQAEKNVLIARIRLVLQQKLSPDELGKITFSCFAFPAEWDKESLDKMQAPLYPRGAPEIPFMIKRCIDVLGGLATVILGSPLFLLIAILIKCTSSGPVLYRQQRIGRYGKKFEFFKFRSMYVNSDHAIHREYVRGLIAGSSVPQKVPNGVGAVYKLTNDPRVTPVGRILRRTSLDELPQFLNVLKGEMSLVGPRPPIPYEVEGYDLWHRRRLLAVKPGITGLWQVKGRSRTTFDEMVRMDLHYARSWSVWLDLKILVQTPRAVLKGAGAY